MKKKLKKAFAITAITFMAATVSSPVHAGLIRKDVWLGDMNEDSKVTLEDAAITLKYALNLQQPDSYEIFIGDMDGNEKVEMEDAKETLRTALHLKKKKRIASFNISSDPYSRQLDIGVKVEEPRAQWISIGKEKVEASRLEGYNDFIKGMLIGKDETYFDDDLVVPVSIEQQSETVEQEKWHRGALMGMVPVHTDNLEDIDCTFLIKTNGNMLFYMEEKNPLNEDKDYCLSMRAMISLPEAWSVSMEDTKIDCYIRRK